MKHLKKYRILYFLLFCLFLGFVTMPLFHSAYFSDMWRSLTKIKWYFQILLFLGTLFLTLALHELAHFVSFLISGYKNEMMIILFFVFYKKNNKWKVKVDFKLLLLGGGMVFPSLGEVNTDEDFIKAKKAMQTSLLAAPLFTLISGVLLFIITYSLLYTNAFLVPFSLYVLIFSLLYTYLSTKEAPGVYGDFKAYKKVKTNFDFALVIVSQYATSLPEHHVNMMRKHLKNQKEINLDLISKSYFIILLDMALQSDEIDYFVLEKVYYYYTSLMSFSRLISNVDNYDLAQAIIFYLERLNFKAEANKLLTLFIVTIENANINDLTKQYYLKQTKHILKLEDNSEFLSNPKNINKGNLTFIMRNIPSFIESEEHKNLGFNELKPHLPIKSNFFID